MPTEANHYCYYTEAPHTGDPYEHLDGNVTLDGAVLENVSGDRFDNRHGIFTVGNNAHSNTTYRFLVDDEVKHTVTVGYGEIPTLPEYQKDGYTFDRWQFDDGCEYDHDSLLFVGGGSEYVDLCAVWIPNTYEVTFVSGEMQKKINCDFGLPISFPEPFEKDGYTFGGWFTLPDGKGEKLASDATYNHVGETTYYAFYEPIAVTPSSDFPTLPVALISSTVVLLIAGAVVWLIISRKRKTAAIAQAEAEAKAAQTAVNAKAEVAPVIVKTRYTDEEIDGILQGIAELNSFTDREIDVFRELRRFLP